MHNRRMALTLALGAALLHGTKEAKKEYDAVVSDVLDQDKARNGGKRGNAAALKRASRKRRNIRARASKRA